MSTKLHERVKMKELKKGLGILATSTMLFSGCATAPCKPPEEVMREKGVVLECFKAYTPDTHDRITQCLMVSKSGAHLIVKTVFKRHCGQYE